jgi:hypothetical protein
MSDFDSDSILVGFQKWGMLGAIFAAIIFVTMKTVKMGGISFDNTEGKSKYMWIFACVSYLVVLVGSFVRDAMAEDDEKGESLMAFLPNLIITTMWYIYMGIALGYKLLSPGTIGAKIRGQGGGRLKGGQSSVGVGKVAGPDGSIGFTLGEAQDKIKILMYMGIAITLINVFSNLYVYYECKEGGCSGDDEGMVKSLVGAQYNIIMIGLAAIVMFIMDVRS